MYLREICGREEGAPPPVDLAAERRNGDAVRKLILSGEIESCHDLSDGGLLVALSEMAMAGRVGASLEAVPSGVPAHGYWFGEDQARYVFACPEGAAAAVLKALGTPASRPGKLASRAATH